MDDKSVLENMASSDREDSHKSTEIATAAAPVNIILADLKLNEASMKSTIHAADSYCPTVTCFWDLSMGLSQKRVSLG